ncbi:unnamed protein product, partial [Rotaria sp. Silwood1]
MHDLPVASRQCSLHMYPSG